MRLETWHPGAPGLDLGAGWDRDSQIRWHCCHRLLPGASLSLTCRRGAVAVRRARLDVAGSDAMWCRCRALGVDGLQFLVSAAEGRMGDDGPGKRPLARAHRWCRAWVVSTDASKDAGLAWELRRECGGDARS